MRQVESLVLPHYHRMYDRLTERVFEDILTKPGTDPELERGGIDPSLLHAHADCPRCDDNHV
jgi:hypothetical protein